MNRFHGPFRPQPLSSHDPYGGSGEFRHELGDGDDSFTAGTWPQDRSRDYRQGGDVTDYPFRRRGRDDASPSRQYGEYEGGSQGRFGEGDMGSSAAQWNDDFRDRDPGRGGLPGFANRGRPAVPAWQDSGDGLAGSFSRGSSPRGYVRSDERIKDDVCERLCRSREIEVEHVSVEVRNGRVLLEGNVPLRAMKHGVEAIVHGTPGVRDIENRIAVGPIHPVEPESE